MTVIFSEVGLYKLWLPATGAPAGKAVTARDPEWVRRLAGDLAA